jgi:hypothetical protein
MQQFSLNGKSHSAFELEKLLSFRFLPAIDFESLSEKEGIRQRGLEKKDVKAGELVLGKRYRQQIENSWIPPVEVRLISENIGYGLFAAGALEKGSYAGEYAGIVRKNNSRYTEPLNDYCYEYPVADAMGRSYVIDARQGHLTRFINHSEKPNLKPCYAFLDGFYHVIFLTLRPISTGEQFS